MNKRNFGRVIARIESNPKKWDQFTGPSTAAFWNRIEGHCGTPYCFLGHALVLKNGRLPRPATLKSIPVTSNGSLAKWLGVAVSDLDILYSPTNKLDDFKRWHKQGRVS